MVHGSKIITRKLFSTLKVLVNWHIKKNQLDTIHEQIIVIRLITMCHDTNDQSLLFEMYFLDRRF